MQLRTKTLTEGFFRLACSQHLYCICRCKPKERIAIHLWTVHCSFTIEIACHLLPASN